MHDKLTNFGLRLLLPVLTAHATFWIGILTGGLNLLWMLVKDYPLMSWNIPLVVGGVFVVSFVFFLSQIFIYGTKEIE